MSFSSKKVNAIHTILVDWYQREKRTLPWRKNQDPYRIWISEIMLQQTRVETVLPYYERFLKAFPTVYQLADSSMDNLRTLWTGLGYYSRAENLRKAAVVIVNKHGGCLPNSYEELVELPGIGPYTAAAISSMAFNQAYASVDGNLERVLSRLLGWREIAKGAKPVSDLAQRLVEQGQPGDINQALMDISSGICSVKNPKCLVCPLTKHCIGLHKNLLNEIPVKKAKTKVVDLVARSMLIFYGKRGVSGKGLEVLLNRRPKGSWLQGLWDLPWWIEDKAISPSPQWKKIGEYRGKRTITHHRIHFTVDCFFVDKKPLQKFLQKKFHGVGKEFSWKSTQNLTIPLPSKRAVQSILKEWKGHN